MPVRRSTKLEPEAGTAGRGVDAHAGNMLQHTGTHHHCCQLAAKSDDSVCFAATRAVSPHGSLCACREANGINEKLPPLACMWLNRPNVTCCLRRPPVTSQLHGERPAGGRRRGCDAVHQHPEPGARAAVGAVRVEHDLT